MVWSGRKVKLKMLFILALVGLVFWLWFNRPVIVHNVATGGLPTSNR